MSVIITALSIVHIDNNVIALSCSLSKMQVVLHFTWWHVKCHPLHNTYAIVLLKAILCVCNVLSYYSATFFQMKVFTPDLLLKLYVFSRHQWA